jgi:hypothetical protein
MDPHDEAPADQTKVTRWQSVGLFFLAVVLLGLIGAVVWFALFVTHYGDPAPAPGIVVDNQTAVSLNIYAVVLGQKPVLRAEIPPRSRTATGVTCGNLEMLAKDDAGHIVARRGPFPTCDEAVWVISTVSLAPSPSPTGG